MSPSGFLLLALTLAPIVGPLLPRRRRPKAGGSGYRPLIIGALLRFGVPATLVIALTGEWRSMLRVPSAFAPLRVWAGVDGFTAADRLLILLAGLGGVAGGIAAGLALTAWRARRGRPEGTLFGDARSVMPSGPEEYSGAALTALTAGITEEAYFRLALPLAWAAAFGAAGAGFALSCLLFGAMHRYQGWRGVVATTLAGAAMSVMYLVTASLWGVMALHALGDLHHLVLRPALRHKIERRRARRDTMVLWSGESG